MKSAIRDKQRTREMKGEKVRLIGEAAMKWGGCTSVDSALFTPCQTHITFQLTGSHTSVVEVNRCTKDITPFAANHLFLICAH
jgi:hypothetical protein